MAEATTAVFVEAVGRAIRRPGDARGEAVDPASHPAPTHPSGSGQPRPPARHRATGWHAPGAHAPMPARRPRAGGGCVGLDGMPLRPAVGRQRGGQIRHRDRSQARRGDQADGERHRGGAERRQGRRPGSAGDRGRPPRRRRPPGRSARGGSRSAARRWLRRTRTTTRRAARPAGTPTKPAKARYIPASVAAGCRGGRDQEPDPDDDLGHPRPRASGGTSGQPGGVHRARGGERPRDLHDPGRHEQARGDERHHGYEVGHHGAGGTFPKDRRAARGSSPRMAEGYPGGTAKVNEPLGRWLMPRGPGSTIV